MVESLELTGRLQVACAEVFNEVTSRLEVGMSEVDIAKQLDEAFAARGVTDHWYDVPFNVLIGSDRFVEGLTTDDYGIKSPAKDVCLKRGSVLYIDLAPMGPITGQWGDWAKTTIFKPRKTIDAAQIAFLSDMSRIHRDGIKQITAESTGADVANYYLTEYQRRGITLQDVRSNVGHSIHAGSKAAADRVWLDIENTTPLGEGIYTVEPGGSCSGIDGELLVARFEVCIYIPAHGPAIILGE